jgi:class 3 adenylate cyclase
MSTVRTTSFGDLLRRLRVAAAPSMSPAVASSERGDRTPSSPPSGTVTILFTDIESSTSLLQRLGPRFVDVLAVQRRLLREAFAALVAGRALSLEEAVAEALGEEPQ